MSGPPSDAPALRDKALDGLRGVAVLMVFGFHYGGGLRSHYLAVRLLGLATESGWTGVVLFFALSGFLITGGLWDSLSEAARWPHALRNFYARRALRILPVYYAALLAAIVAALLAGADLAGLRIFAIFAFFLQDLPWLASRAIAGPSSLPLYHLWSLAVEEQFYLLWPALLLLALARPAPRRLAAALRLCVAVFALAFIFRLVVYGVPCFYSVRGLPSPLPNEHLFDSFLLTQAGALALGAALALLLRSTAGTAWVARWAMPLFLSGVVLYAGTSFLSHSFYLITPLQYMLGLPAVSLAAAALIPLLLRPGLPRRTFSVAPLGFVGRISYGFYVLQVLLQPLFNWLGEHLTHATNGSAYQAARLLVALPITLLAACISFYLLEQPFLRRKRRYPMHEPLPAA